MRTLAIPLLVYHLTGSAVSVGLTYALEFLPAAIFSLVGGSLADRLDRRRLMIVCDFGRFAVLVVFVVADIQGVLTLPLVYGGVIVISICGSVFLSGQWSSLPFLLGPDRSAAAISALFATEQATNILVPPVGGALFAVAGALPALAVNAATYLTSQLSLAFVPTLGPQAPGKPPSLRDLVKDIVEGFRFVSQDLPMRAVSWLSFFFNFFGMLGFAVFIPYLKRAFGATDAQVGLAVGVSAVGAVLGSLVAGKTARRWPFGRSMAISWVIDGLVFVPVMFTTRFWIALTFWAITNAFATFEVTQIVGWRTRVAPPDKVGRVFGAVRLIALNGVVFGTVLGGYLADRFGVRFPIVISGFAYLALGLAAVSVKSLRRDTR